MTGATHETLEGDDDIKPPSDRSTGAVFAVVAFIIAALTRNGVAVPLIALAFAVAFATVSWLRPAILQPLTLAWFRFGLILNRIMSPVVMGLLYFLVMVPFGLAMQLVRDPLNRKRKSAESYWVVRDKSAPATSMRNQF